MTSFVEAFCTNGEFERTKATVHVVMLVGATACAVYNAAAFLRRRETHNAVNVLMYTALSYWEWKHIRHHLDDIDF